MFEELIYSASNTLQGGAPEWVMYMPGGEHEIHASKNGKPVTLKVKITEADAAKLQASLLGLKKPGHPDPHVGFDHNPGPASFWPEEFAWKTEPAPGIYLKAKWTAKGKEAVVAADGESASYRYFSPTFLASDKGELIGLPSSGEIGSLVNNPAFRQIAALAASQSQPALSMTEEEITALKAQAAEGEKAKKELGEMKIKVAAAAVSKAVDDGKIAPLDAATQDYWKASLASNPDSQAILDKLPVAFPVKAASSVGGQVSASATTETKVPDGAAISAAAQTIRSEALKAGNHMPWQVAWNSALANAGLNLACEYDKAS